MIAASSFYNEKKTVFKCVEFESGMHLREAKQRH